VLTPVFELDHVVVDEEAIAEHAASDTFENVNTADELRAAAARFAEE
jgi:molybdopterin-guanine dinucleotide biosynthesis protein A